MRAAYGKKNPEDYVWEMLTVAKFLISETGPSDINFFYKRPSSWIYGFQNTADIFNSNTLPAGGGMVVQW